MNRRRALSLLILSAAKAGGAEEGTRRAISAQSMLRGLAPHRWRHLDPTPDEVEIRKRLHGLAHEGFLIRLPNKIMFQITEDGARAFRQAVLKDQAREEQG